MKAGMKINKILAATVLALAAPSAFAQTISASNTNANTNTAFPPGHIATVTMDRQGQTVNGFLFELEYNTTILSLGAQHTDPNVAHPRVTTVGTGGADFGCVELVVGTLRCLTSAPVTSATFQVNIAFSTTATAGVSTLNFDQTQTNFVNAAFADTPFTAVTNGSVTTMAVVALPPALTFAPAGGTVLSGSNITITPSGGQAGGSATYTCVPGGGVIATNPAGAIATGGAAVSMNVSCPAGPDGSLSCTHTGGAGSTASPVNYTIDCPAVPQANVQANPGTGTALGCNGPAGSTQTAQVGFTNTGNADATGFACVVGGAGFTLQQAPSATIAQGGGTTAAVVACTVPADGAPPIAGTLTCNGGVAGTGPFAYTLSSQAQNQGGLTQATIVPASSLWSKVGLVGLLAVLGMLVVGFRRK
jgi:hypothetical protein